MTLVLDVENIIDIQNSFTKHVSSVNSLQKLNL